MQLFKNDELVENVTILEIVEGKRKTNQKNTFGGSYFLKGRKPSDEITFITKQLPIKDAKYKLIDDKGTENLIKILDIDTETDDIVVTAIIKE